jgi:hypothetical protein
MVGIRRFFCVRDPPPDLLERLDWPRGSRLVRVAAPAWSSCVHIAPLGSARRHVDALVEPLLSPARVQFDTGLRDDDSSVAVVDSEPHVCWRGQDGRNSAVGLPGRR